MTEILLEGRNIWKSINDQVILRGVNLVVKEGEIVMIVGPNGAGKTVLLCCLAGGLVPTNGRIRFCGISGTRKTKQQVNFLPQSGMAIEHLSGRENIEFYTRLHDRSRDQWSQLTSVFGIADELDKIVRNYSGGMIRKLELSITLDVDASVYLLDEPTAGLDLNATRTVHDLLIHERNQQKSFVISSHIPGDMDVADKVVFLVNGRLSTPEDPEFLLNSLPPVIRIKGKIRQLPESVRKYLAGDQLFIRGDEARGFLKPMFGFDDIVSFLDMDPIDFHVTKEPASYTDLFNYQTRITYSLDGSASRRTYNKIQTEERQS